MAPDAATDPRVFIASSAEGIRVAEALQRGLDHGHEVTMWTQGVFGPTGYTLESLFETAASADFAIFLVDADDVTTSRGQEHNITRDNVIFELGLFLGKLGRERCFMVYDRTRPPKLPTDLTGVNPVLYRIHTNGNIDASVGAATSTLAERMKRIGRR